MTKIITNELKNIINYKIDKIYEPDKNTIIVGLYGKGENLALLLCISANNCRIHLTTHQQTNPTSAPNFCMLLRKHINGYKIKNISSIDLERIIFIDLENNENLNKPINKRLIVELMGKHSNIILVNEQNVIIDSLRHTSIEANSNRDIYPTSKYIFPETFKYSFLELKNFDDFYSKIEPKLTKYQSKDNTTLSISNFNIEKIISETFNGISISFVNNIIKNLSINYLSKETLEKIYNKIKQIINSNHPALAISEDKKDYFLFDSEITPKPYLINFALDDFYYQKENSELFKNYRNSILNLILATLRKYEKRLQNIDTKLLECNNRDKYRLYGELITSNLYKLPNKNLESIELENYYNNNEKVIIPLDSRYLPSRNAKQYFKKYSKLKNALDIVAIQKQETIQDINYMESIVYEINECSNLNELEEIYEEISESSIFSGKLKTSQKKKDSKKHKAKLLTKNKNAHFNPLKYIIDGYTIFVGRNNLENDYLTCKFAKKTDLWFHTKNTHGSHVILKTNSNEAIPEEIIFQAAKLAVQHSKAKNSSHTPVDYCMVSNVKKPSGSKPGFVIYTNNKTIYV
ncbi:MAG: NFACT family protein [Clostridia bacterium]|nr:NFACT family protein [Clostridia bacterium]